MKRFENIGAELNHAWNNQVRSATTWGTQVYKEQEAEEDEEEPL